MIYNYLWNILWSIYFLVCNVSECLNKILGIWKIVKISDVFYKNLEWELKLIFDYDKIMYEICIWNCYILLYINFLMILIFVKGSDWWFEKKVIY